MTRRKKRPSPRIDLRLAYDASGSRGDYSRWIRNKIDPIVGAGALRLLPSKKGSKVSEWSVTPRNMGRIAKSLGLTIDLREPVRRPTRKTNTSKKQNATKMIKALGEDLTAELIVGLLNAIPQPKGGKNQLVYRIPVHGFSNNYQYKDLPGGRKVSTAAYTKWKKTGAVTMDYLISPDDHDKVDFTKPVHLDLHFKHIPAMDTTNLIKSAQDLIFTALDKNDNIVKSCSVTGEDSEGYADGHIIAKLRNI